MWDAIKFITCEMGFRHRNLTKQASAVRGLLRVGCMPRLGLAEHPDQDYAVPLPLLLRRGNRLHFEGFYELIRA